MKKFTGIFLLVEHAFKGVLRKIGLSMVAILMAVTVFGQTPNGDAQDTYHVFAEKVSDCYRADNDYAVEISMRDFVEIDSFRLVLTFDDALFSYKNVTGEHSQIDGVGTGLSVSVVSQSGDDKLVMVWDSGDDPQTIEPNNDTTTVFVLHFGLKGFQHVDGSLAHYQTDLTWLDESSVWNYEGQTSEILTWYVDAGEIDVTQSWPNLEVKVENADCDGGEAIATVTSPVYQTGMLYSFNGNTFTSDSTASLVAPSGPHTVEVMLDECISFVETFSVGAADPIGYYTDEVVFVDCPGGYGDIEIDSMTGTGPYTYFIVPLEDWGAVANGLQFPTMNKEQANEFVSDYEVGNRINELPVGTYFVAVQDANLCADLRDLDWWTPVTIVDEREPWMAVETEHADETCATFGNGKSTLYVSGATPFVDGYNVLVDGVLETNHTDSLILTALEPGAYDITFIDSLQCQWDTTIVIAPAEPISFDVGQTDASCEIDNGEIWIDLATITGGSGSDWADWDWSYATQPDFSDAVAAGTVEDTATGLAPNVYYVRVYDSIGCFDDYVNINNDNAVKILSVEFDLVYDSIACNGGTTDVTVTVANPANHVFGYSMDGTTYTSDNVFEALGANTYTFYVHDSTIDCTNSWTTTIGEPDELVVSVIDLLTSEPSCHDANDGHIQVRAAGGTSFESMGETYFYKYKFDERPWENGGVDNTFAADTGMHTIVVEDYYGCRDTIYHTFSLTPNTIAVVDEYVECFGDLTDLPNNDSTSIVVSWISEPAGQNQGDREPQIYFSDVYMTAAEITSMGTRYTDTTMFGAGDYYFAAIDEWGCMSNVDTLTVTEPVEIMANAEAVKVAGCDGINDGQIKIEAWLGLERKESEGRYQYSFTQSAAIMQQSDWYDQVDWHDFTNDDPDNDSIVYVDVQKGTYYIAVRDYCGAENPELIQGPWEVFVDGADALEIDWDLVTVDSVTCNVYGKTPGSDGAITGLLDATEGGWGDYVYTLDKMAPTAVTKSASADDDRFPETNMTGEFIDLPAGYYILTVEDDSLGCIASYEVEIGIPEPLMLVTDSAYVSCNGAHDGIIRYMISGGTAPYMETTNNVGLYENASSIPADRWYATDSTVFDRRVRAGIYQIYVKDAHGCIYGPVIDTIKQPDALMLEVAKEIMPSCADDGVSGTTDDGEIWVIPSGGWDVAGYEYEVSIDDPGAVMSTSDDTIIFTGLTADTYVIEVLQHNGALASNPLNTYSDYFEKWGNGDYDSQLPWQNSSEECTYEISVDLQGPDPIVYDTVAFYDEQCYNTPTGQIHLENISGGTKPYTVWVEGPVAYSPSTGGIGADTTLPDTVTSYIWDDLVRGHYTVYIKDAAGCQLVKESGEVERPDSLMITSTKLIDDAMCNGGNGTIAIVATGGTGAYEYAVDSALVPDDGTHPFPPEDLVWQLSDTFYVPAATWVSWVRDEAGCVAGYATDAEGDPIMQHRVTVREPDSIKTDVLTQAPADCYGYPTGSITLDTVYGGNGATWTIQVSGTDYDGNAVLEEYTSTDSADIVLDGLLASTNEDDTDDMTDEDYYTVVIYDSEGCMSMEYKQFVLQPEPFIVTLEDKNNAFVCPNDKAGLFEIKVVSGGTPWPVSNNYEYMWEAYKDADMTDEVDSLRGEWGFTSTYLGYGDLYYRVSARDYNGCVTSKDTFVDAPDPITFDLYEASCYGDTLASVRVYVDSPEGRKVRLLYKEILGDTPSADTFTVHNVWFDDMLDVEQLFNFDNENLQDRHYAFMLEDTLGCTTEIDTMTFDEVQHPLVIDEVVVGESVGCETTIEVTAAGGIPPYVLLVNNEPQADMTATLATGSYEISVIDAHMRCVSTVTDSIVVSCELTIAEVQSMADSSDYVGDIVEITGTVSAVGDGVFYVQDDNAAWSGIKVVSDEVVALGDGVVVVGTVDEVDGVTVITDATVTVETATLTVEAIEVLPEDVADEMYESVLVYVHGVRANAADSTGKWTAYTEDTISVTVDTTMYTSVPVEGNFYDVTGIVNGMDSMYYVEPRMEEDVVDLTATGIEDPITGGTIEFKVYPNPFDDRIIIDNNDKLTRVIISNIAGQRVMDIEYPSHEIRTAKLVSGVYLIRMFTEEGNAKTETMIKR
ncbi:T9SS type A sorting domain-containing protein [Maribellus comscasis]|uniref:T9SS type A sorting domain-containing protein n=1 Tax=Maribellus comscasis TaxID=2681766 RepID=A0A6I6JQ30_9BACT|nr:T9SS type A sorting domain-containing protein [Maribellus comscasis]QGY43110.1 T9SS type A sorting domain-containing protein [Maribellus comscasis]